MPFLPNIIKRIDEFFKIAERYSLVSLGADDQALHAELVKASREVLNPEVSYNLVALAAMYQKALEINGGFNTIYKAISGMVEDMDPDEEETEPVENLLNQIASSIKARAQRPDSPSDMRELQMAASAARTEESPFNYDEPEEGDEESAYEAMLGFGGAEKAFEEAGGVSQFDMTGGVNPEAAQSGTGRGYSVGKARTLKDWATFYANESAKYNSLLTDPTNMLAPSARIAREDIRVKSNIQDLDKVLKQLSALTIAAIKIQNKIDIETEADHTQDNEELAKIRAELGQYEQKRRLLKRNLNSLVKKIELDTLKQKALDPNLSKQEKRILDEKIALQDLRTRGAYGYGKEAKERARLIAALTADPNLSDEQVKKMKEKISGAAQFTDRMTKAQYDRKITEQKGQELGREGPSPTYKAERGGGRTPMERLPQEQQINLEKASFDGLVYQFQIDIASATQAARQAIYEIKATATKAADGKKTVKKQLNTEYKGIIDEISNAIRKGDRNALQALKQKFVDVVSQDANVHKYEIRGYLDVIRLEPHFRKILDSIKEVTKNPSKKELKENPNVVFKVDNNGNLIVENYSEADLAIFRMILNDMLRIRLLYDKYYLNISDMTTRRADKIKRINMENPDWWAIKKSINARFKNVIQDMKKIEVRLSDDLKVKPPALKGTPIPRSPDKPPLDQPPALKQKDTSMQPELSPKLKEIWQNLEKTDPKRFEKEKAKWLEESLKAKSSSDRMLLLKAAQEATGNPEVDQATADRLAQELADNIIDQVYQAAFNEIAI